MSSTASLADFASAVVAVRVALAAGFKNRTFTLPLLPTVASKVMTMANDPDADVADLSDLIHKDQSLASAVLRIANSAAYTAGEPIVSLRQAVMRLGMQVLSEIAIAACLQSEGLRTPGYEPYRKRVLVHAFVTGGFAKELARQKRRNVEAMFLCGLLHSIGRPLVLRLIGEVQAGRPVMLPERAILPLVDEFHREAAAAVTETWKLPQQVQVAAAYHGDPDGAPAFVEETRQTTLAAKIARWALGQSQLDEAKLRALPEWEKLNFYPDELDAVLERKDALVASASVFTS
ncbi:hypothetical protein ASA1KI_14110 [Opitutales bacterium ASA1]|uniref:HDOD domain-containing protein n=1 Tax=Congregicoccus parvus TaxID=3081749 RepID=UPI002B2B92DE|nr:hypothetical protein ASA1KI_14110 [Opitutales bacterium ASA1]